MDFKIAIVGCRYYNNYFEFFNHVETCLAEIEVECDITIISGGCTGVDKMAGKYAIEKGYGLEVYPAEIRKRCRRYTQ